MITRTAKNKSGQFLLEAVVALSILTVATLGIFPVISSSIGFNRAATDKDIAVGLAGEGIEVVKSLIDANVLAGDPWNQGLMSCGAGCSVEYNSAALGSSQGNFLRFDPAAHVYNYGVGTNTVFKRVITITGVPAGSPIELRVRSRVDWTGRNDVSDSVLMEGRFFDWR